jgi:TonB family protein
MPLRTTFAVIVSTLFVIRTDSCFSAEVPGINACSLLSDGRVSAIIGVAMAPGQQPKPGVCNWAVLPVANRSGVGLQLAFYSAMVGSTAVDAFNVGKSPTPGITKTPIVGVGDDAYYMTQSNILGTSIHVRKGSVAFLIRLFGFSVEETKVMEKQLAEEVVSKPALNPVTAITTWAPARFPAAGPPPYSGHRTPVRVDPNHPFNVGEEFYPEESRHFHEEGRCVVQVQVDADGSVHNPQIISSTGYPRLDDACIAAVQTGRFIPATEDGKPVSSVVGMPITWKLRTDPNLPPESLRP